MHRHLITALVFSILLVGLLLPMAAAGRGEGYQQYLPLVRHIAGIPQGYSALVESNADGDYDLYRVADGGETVDLLTTNTLTDRFGSLSPDGTRILYHHSGADTMQDLYVMDANGDNNHRLATLHDFEDGTWSPDSNRILISQTYVENDANTAHFYITNPNATDELLSLGEFTDINQAYGQWSPTQDEILLTVCFNPDLFNCKVYRVSADDGERTLLFEGATRDQQWLPDGTRVVYSAFDGASYEIYAVNRDGTRRDKLTENSLDDIQFTLGVDNSLWVVRNVRPGRDEYGLIRVYLDGRPEIAVALGVPFPVVQDQTEDGSALLYATSAVQSQPEFHLLDTTTLSDTVLLEADCAYEECGPGSAQFDSSGRWVVLTVSNLTDTTSAQLTDLYLADVSTPEPTVTFLRSLLSGNVEWLPDTPYFTAYLPDEQNFAGIPALYHAPSRTMTPLPLGEAPYTFYEEWRRSDAR